MTTGWGGVRLAPVGVDDDPRAEKGVFARQQCESPLKQVSNFQELEIYDA